MKLLLTVTAISLLSCNQKEQIKTVSFKLDYPKSFRKDNNILYSIKEKLTVYIGLGEIAKAADSFTLRIWEGFGLIAGVNLYELKFIDGNWIGTRYYFQDRASDYSYFNKSNYYGVNDEVDSFWMAKRFIPLCSWKDFADTMMNNGILSLPDQDDIPDCRIGGFDGSTFLFEWANKKEYRYYTFWAFSNSSCIENKTFQDFSAFLKRQLGLDYCWPKCWITK